MEAQNEGCREEWQQVVVMNVKNAAESKFHGKVLSKMMVYESAWAAPLS